MRFPIEIAIVVIAAIAGWILGGVASAPSHYPQTYIGASQ